MEVKLSMADYLQWLLLREELEYDTADDIKRGVHYEAPSTSRFRHPSILFVISSIHRFVATLTSVNAWVRRPKIFKLLSVLVKLSPELIKDSLLTTAKEGSSSSVMTNAAVPQNLKTALRSLQLATQDVVGTDGHRRLLRHEGVAYSLAFGPPLVFTTPNLADGKLPMLLAARGLTVNFDVPEPDLLSDDGMKAALASDPVSQAIAFEVMMRLFFIFVLGVRPECVGRPRGEVWKGKREWVTDGCAASSFYPGIFGPVRAFRGPIEAQGRGSLHPHILIWLVAWAMDMIVELLLREPDELHTRLREWQQQYIRAILSVQQSSVQHLPVRFGFHETEDWGPSLPWRTEQHSEFTLAEEPGAPYPHLPNSIEIAPCLATKEETMRHDLFLKTLHKKNIRPASSTVPLYRRSGSGPPPVAPVSSATSLATLHLSNASPSQGDHVSLTERSDMESLLLGMPTSCLPNGNEFERAMLHDAMRLVVECHVHKCGPSCFKYTASKKKYQLCRHMFYHVVKIFSQSSATKVVRIRTKTAAPLPQARPLDRFRLSGKVLRNVVGVHPDGRVMPWQMHAYEGSTNYCGLVALRCNLDVQDLRRILVRLSETGVSLVPSPLPSLGPCPTLGVDGCFRCRCGHASSGGHDNDILETRYATVDGTGRGAERQTEAAASSRQTDVAAGA